jgi:hypothetical protein
VRLRATIWHLCGLRPGDRVLLAAEPSLQVLRVYPPATLDDLLPPVDSNETASLGAPRGGGAR